MTFTTFNKLVQKDTFLQKVVRAYKTNAMISIGTILILTLLITALFASWIAPHSPYEQHLDLRRLPPFTNPQYPLGTDELGRCLLSRVIYGGRVSLSVGFLTSALSALIGIPIGLIAGYSTKFLNELLGRFIDLTLSTPEILLALALATILGRSLLIVMVAVSLVWWANYARIIRGQVLQLREMDYIVAARTIGAPDVRIIFRHIFPNTIAQALVMTSLNMAAAILIEAGLSFLGLGTQPPTPSWGTMLSTGRNFLQSSAFLATIPGIAIMVTVLGFNLLGDGLRDILDPRLRK
jgi:peptide/nickel transport system permease protein